MKIKTFQALTMHEALKAIKDELGPDAVILSSKQIRKGGGMFGLFGQPMVEVSAAVDLAPGSPSLRRGSAAQGHPAHARERWVPTTGAQRVAGARDGWRPPSPGRQPAGGGRGAFSAPRDAGARGTASRLTAKEKGFGETLEDSIARSLTTERPDRGSSERAAAQEGRLQDWGELREELRGLRRLVESSLLGGKRESAPAASWQEGLPPLLAARYRDLVRTGLEPETARRYVEDVAQRRPAFESEAALQQALARSLARDVKAGGPLLGLGEWKKTVIFTGPTGVGKTTTIAKLAAHYKLKEKRSVALITLDTYRVAAVEQLRMYANVIGIPLDVALTKREALDCIGRRRKSELILIDTAGRSPMDETGMEELRQLVSLDHPLETHLVLSATTREQDLKEGVARFAGIPITHLLFTKLDETTGYGGLFELMRKTGLPLSYFSTGQAVPEDLEVARPDRLADLLLGGLLRGRSKTALNTEG
ncbi:MAG: flagellar biosynthesis protein FlhF [Nitrospirota bacterium]